MKLITLADIQRLKPMSMNVNVVKELDPYILEAQEFDLKPILGTPFYLDIIANIADDDYLELLNGKEYEYKGKTYNHNGIRSCLVYFCYERFIGSDQEKQTASGLRVKLNEFSEPASEKSILRRMNQARSAASVYRDEFLLYLERFPDEFPLYERKCKSQRTGSIRISKVNRT